MRVYVRSVDSINPADFSRVGAAYTDEPENFMYWMDINCPSSICYVDHQMKPGPESMWKAYVRFDLPSDEEWKVFVDRWGSHREKLD